MSSNSSQQFRITGYGVGSPKIGLAPPAIIADRAPTTNDYRFPIGQEWIYQISAGNDEVYFLGDVQANIATWILAATSVAGILTITGNSGGAVPGDGSNNINLLGTGNIAVTGDIGTNTLTITNAEGFIQQVRQKVTGVTTTSAFLASSATIPQITDGTQIFSVSITPTNANSILLFQINSTFFSDSGGAFIAIFQDATASAITGNCSTSGEGMLTLSYFMTSGTISSTTFTVRYGGTDGSGNTSINTSNSGSNADLGDTISTVFTITEYAS